MLFTIIHPTPPAPRSPPPLTASHRKPFPPVPPKSLVPQPCIARLSASPPVPPRFAPLVTTPRQRRNPRAHPWQSLKHLEMPTGMPGSHQTRPRQSSAPPQHPRQRLMATHQDTPSIGTPHPCGTSLPDGFAVREVAVRRVSVRPLKVVDLQRAPRASPRVPACAYRVDVTSR